ncbi:interleukin-10 receptor subunit beta-like isoform X2 [Ranitomeya imitator]|uniref:interleukin-10 receptor subunit beta-like isoform X2 n=1 Tax=Ranitomeya imitator TaxID=111125 RepID=UPI0037E788E4
MDYHYGLLIFICGWIPGFGKLPIPTNVTMESINFRNILRWNRPAELGGNVSYTVQYKMDFSSERDDYKYICERTHKQQCDSSIITYKSYVRVRTELNSKQSDWVTIHFDPDHQTIIGAPNTTVSSRSGYLDVSFNGPFVNSEEYFIGRSIKERYGELTYRVFYWKESDPAHVLNITTEDNTEILHDLKTWTVYCVKVQAYVPQFHKAGKFSPVMCNQTTEDAESILRKKIAACCDLQRILDETLQCTSMSASKKSHGIWTMRVPSDFYTPIKSSVVKSQQDST